MNRRHYRMNPAIFDDADATFHHQWLQKSSGLQIGSKDIKKSIYLLPPRAFDAQMWE